MNEENKNLIKSFPKVSINDRIDLELVRYYEFIREQRLLLFEIKFEEEFINRLKNFMVLGANNFITLILNNEKNIINDCTLLGFKTSEYNGQKTLILLFEIFANKKKGITITKLVIDEKHFKDIRKDVMNRREDLDKQAKQKEWEKVKFDLGLNPLMTLEEYLGNFKSK